MDNKNIETVIVKADDNYVESCLEDSVNAVSTKTRKPEGYVEIFSIDENGNKQQIGKKNLVLYVGREWIASRLCNLNNPNILPSQSQYLSWLGLGNEGCPIGDPLNPNTPVNTLVGLSNDIPISSIDTECGDLRGGYYYKHPFDSIEFQQDPANNNNWLILKITTTISTMDANGYNINEAGLFLCGEAIDSGPGTPQIFAGPFDIFSIVTFPSIVKDSSRQLVFYWYLYC